MSRLCPNRSTMRLMTSLMDEFQPGTEEGAPPPPGASMDESSKIQLVEVGLARPAWG